MPCCSLLCHTDMDECLVEGTCVSTWTAPSIVPAIGATRWHLMGRAAKALGSSRSRPSELSYTQSRGFPRLFPSTWLCLSPWLPCWLVVSTHLPLVMVTPYHFHSSLSPSCVYADINECNTQAACPSGLCLSTEGSYSCMVCDTGYAVSRDGSMCEGIPGTKKWVLEGMREETSTLMGYWWVLGTLVSGSFSISLTL